MSRALPFVTQETAEKTERQKLQLTGSDPASSISAATRFRTQLNLFLMLIRHLPVVGSAHCRLAIQSSPSGGKEDKYDINRS